jgi:hypothetical protein
MTNYNARQDPRWLEVEPTVEGYSDWIVVLLQQRHKLTEVCADLLLAAHRSDTDALRHALEEMQQTLTEIETVWCEQCGDQPALHFGYANLCDECYARVATETE